MIYYKYRADKRICQINFSCSKEKNLNLLHLNLLRIGLELGAREISRKFPQFP